MGVDTQRTRDQPLPAVGRRILGSTPRRVVRHHSPSTSIPHPKKGQVFICSHPQKQASDLSVGGISYHPPPPPFMNNSTNQSISLIFLVTDLDPRGAHPSSCSCTPASRTIANPLSSVQAFDICKLQTGLRAYLSAGSCCLALLHEVC